jgi:hypothetical protein
MCSQQVGVLCVLHHAGNGFAWLPVAAYGAPVWWKGAGGDAKGAHTHTPAALHEPTDEQRAHVC